MTLVGPIPCVLATAAVLAAASAVAGRALWVRARTSRKENVCAS